MIDTPSTRERFLDAQGLAIAGGILAALVAIGVVSGLRLRDSLDRAAWDRVATALADTPVTPQLLVVRAASRTGDWMVSDAVLRLDSAGAQSAAIAIDMSVPVAPAGSLPDLLATSPRVVVGVTLAGDSVAWPWFVPEALRVRRNTGPRIGLTALLRDPDGVVRTMPRAATGERWLDDEVAARLARAPVTKEPADSRPLRLRFADAGSDWYGIRAMSIDSVLALDLATLRQRVTGTVALLGIDDGSTVPTSVGAMPALAILAHDINDRIQIARGERQAVRDASWPLVVLWLASWVLIGAVGAALTSIRVTPVLAVGGILLQAALVLWLVDGSGMWLPLGSTLLVWVAALLGVEAVSFWQVRRRQRLTTLLFSRFVTPELATAAWSERHLYLEGGRPAPLQLPVTVLFVDLRGFTRFSESHVASEVMQLLTDVTAACTADIATFGGLVDDFAGDGIKADFGVPVPRRDTRDIERDAENAVNCAVVLAATIERLLPASIGKAGTQARIGIHSGVAVAGTIGGATRLKYTVVGDVVNVAARLQSVDLPDDSGAPMRCRIIVSGATMLLLGGKPPAVDDLGELSLSGRSQPVQAFRLRSAQISAP